MSEAAMRRREVPWDDPETSARRLAGMSGLEFLLTVGRGELPAPPVARALGIEPGGVERGRAVFTVTPGERHCGPPGRVHGGLAAILCDTALGCAVHTVLPAGTGYATLELKVDFARPVTPRTGRLECEATVVHQGSHSVIAQAQVADVAGELYARATATCLLLRHPSGTVADDRPSRGAPDGPGPGPVA